MLLMCLVVLAAPPSPSTPEKPRLAILALTPAGVDAATVESMGDALTAEAAHAGWFQVTSQKDIQTLLGIEREKQLLGCSDAQSSCMAELAGALGARFVLSGGVARLGDAYQLTLQTVDTVKAQPLGRATRIAGDLQALSATIPYALAEATATPPPAPPSRALPITLIGGGTVGLLGGGVLFLLSLTREQAAQNELALADRQLTLKPASYYRTEAQAVVNMRIIGSVVAGVGLAALIAGITVLKLEPGGGARVALLLTGTGAALAGVWP